VCVVLSIINTQQYSSPRTALYNTQPTTHTHTHTLNVPNYGIEFATELFITKYASIYVVTEMR